MRSECKIGKGAGLLISAFVLLCGCANNSSENFKTEQYYFGQQDEVGVPVRSEDAGVLAMRSYPGYVDLEYRRLFTYELQAGQLVGKELCLTAELPEGIIQSLLHGDNVLLERHSIPFSEIKDFCSGVSYIAYNIPSRSIAEEFNPEILLTTTPWENFGAPFALWDSNSGLLLLPHLGATRQVIGWQGHEKLREIGRTPPTLATGRTYVEGRLNFVYLVDDGAIYRFNAEQSRTEQLDDFSLLGQLLKREIDNMGGMANDSPRFVLAAGLAAIKARNRNAIMVFDAAGNKLYISMIETRRQPSVAEALRLVGVPPGAKPTQQQAEAANQLFTEGIPRKAQYPLTVVDKMAYLAPFDETHIAVIDRDTRLLILVSAKDVGTAGQ